MTADEELALLQTEYANIMAQLADLPGLVLTEQGRNIDVNGTRASLQNRQEWLIERIQQLQQFTILSVVR